MSSVGTIAITTGSIYLRYIPHTFEIQVLIFDNIVMNKETVYTIFITIYERIIVFFA